MSDSICQPTDCFILQLPDEVLIEIIDAAASWPDDPDCCAFYDLYACRWALTLVCRRFHLLAVPILYSQITLGHLLQPPQPGAADWYERSEAPVEDGHNGVANAMCLLRRSIEENPSLRPLCTEMVFDVGACFSHLESLYRLLAVFVNTKSLRVHNGFEDTQFPQTCACLVTALANMSHLERLAITGGRRPVKIQHVMPVLDGLTPDRYPRLKEIMLAGIVRSVLPVRIQLWVPHPSLDSWYCQRAPITRLTISDYYEQPQTLRVLLKKPARLEHFTYLGIRRFGWHPLDLRTLWSYLVPHMLTLETIRIGSMSNCSPHEPLTGLLSGVDFTLFERLRLLSLSYFATGSDAGESSVLAPHLETFEWVFDAEDGRSLYLNSFGKQEEDFLWRLAAAAVSRRSALRRINIIFRPATSISTTVSLDNGRFANGPSILMSWAHGERETEYPWDRMDRVAREVRKFGIAVTYNKPSVTREEFDEAAHNIRQGLTDGTTRTFMPRLTVVESAP
ncbi:hypothetical protein C8A03DRAFT_15027 [Achaetomium macrosporum]|uniref:F-box domain-containing protein n=1 Tax=Achaetomium macrosporum TaxID=79813 RepID=A0AAN7CAU0_9PEZI|nr:hypothetical protein C8A03DRAFT_15027 [Achaetomium macrosporum]